MEIISPIHGEMTYEEKDIINFKKGIPGFDELNKFIIKEIEDSSFKVLQSIDDAELGFVLISPFDVELDYEIKLNSEIRKNLDIKNEKEVALYSLVTLNSKVENITANLRAPLVINIISKKGEQCIIEKEEYKIKHPIVKG